MKLDEALMSAHASLIQAKETLEYHIDKDHSDDLMSFFISGSYGDIQEDLVDAVNQIRRCLSLLEELQ